MVRDGLLAVTYDRVRRTADWIDKSGRALKYVHANTALIAGKPSPREFFDYLIRLYPNRLNVGSGPVP